MYNLVQSLILDQRQLDGDNSTYDNLLRVVTPTSSKHIFLVLEHIFES
jgi:hypothetical protein